MSRISKAELNAAIATIRKANAQYERSLSKPATPAIAVPVNLAARAQLMQEILNDLDVKEWAIIYELSHYFAYRVYPTQEAKEIAAKTKGV